MYVYEYLVLVRCTSYPCTYVRSTSMYYVPSTYDVHSTLYIVPVFTCTMQIVHSSPTMYVPCMYLYNLCVHDRYMYVYIQVIHRGVMQGIHRCIERVWLYKMYSYKVHRTQYKVHRTCTQYIVALGLQCYYLHSRASLQHVCTMYKVHRTCVYVRAFVYNIRAACTQARCCSTWKRDLCLSTDNAVHSTSVPFTSARYIVHRTRYYVQGTSYIVHRTSYIVHLVRTSTYSSLSTMSYLQYIDVLCTSYHVRCLLYSIALQVNVHKWNRRARDGPRSRTAASSQDPPDTMCTTPIDVDVHVQPRTRATVQVELTRTHARG